MPLALVLALAFCRPAQAALNLAQAVEDAIIHFRKRVFVPDGLVMPAWKLEASGCDSSVDGPHCANWPESKTSESALLVDGVISARLFSSAGGGELLDEQSMRPSLAAIADPPRERPPSLDGHPRSSVLSLHRLPPWSRSLPTDFAGRLPFSVQWRGPWALVESKLPTNPVVKPGRFAAELRSAVGSIHFGRPVHIQAVDLAKPPGKCSAGERPTRVADFVLPESPMVIRGRRDGREIFAEVIPPWELSTYVNVVAFTAFTSLEPVDEISFLGAECSLLGAIQLSFGASMFPKERDAKQTATPVSMLISLRNGWKAYSWEDIEFRSLDAVRDAPAWSLEEVVSHRLRLRKGIFDEPQTVAWEESFEDFPLGVGPETIRMPSGLEEVTQIDPDYFESLNTVMSNQRNSSVFIELMEALADNVQLSLPRHATLLEGVAWPDLHSDLIKLLEALTEDAEGGSASIVRATSAEDVFDAAWRQGLDSLDCLLLRLRSAQSYVDLHEDAHKLPGLATLSFEDGPLNAGTVIEKWHAVGSLLQNRTSELELLYLPEYIRGTRILVENQYGTYLVDNSVLLDSTLGVGYRLSKAMDDRYPTGDYASFGDHVIGKMVDGWLEVKAKDVVGSKDLGVKPELVNAIFSSVIVAMETIALRIRKKSVKLASASQFEMATTSGYQVRLEPGPGGVQIVVTDKNGRQATSNLGMQEMEMAALLEDLDPSSQLSGESDEVEKMRLLQALSGESGDEVEKMRLLQAAIQDESDE